MAKALLELETIDADQIDDIMSGQPPRPPKPTQATTPGTTIGPEPSAARRPRRIRPSHGSTPDRCFRRSARGGARRRAPLFCLACRAVMCGGTVLHFDDILRAGKFAIDLARRCVMGILNVTADSFSDGGRSRPRCSARARAADARRRRGHRRHRRRIDAPRRARRSTRPKSSRA